MTEPLIRVDQIWERKGTGRRVRVTYIYGPALYGAHRYVGLTPLGHGRQSSCKTSTLLRDYRIITAPPAIGDWP